MNSSSIDILKKYIEGKDRDQYQILEEIYAENATVEFEIKSEQISFPNKISGNIEIAKVLSADFNKKYKNVKTYYLSRPASNQKYINGQKWLVIMEDIQLKKTRIGTGYYDWVLTDFGSDLIVQKHKIHIHEMLELADASSELLKDLQSKLDYPFVEKESVSDIIGSYLVLKNIKKYIMK